MPVHNSDIADVLTKIADLLDIKGANQFRIRAYRNAARTISGLSRNIKDMVEGGEDLEELPGIGKDLARKIATIAVSGTLPQLEDLEEDVPSELAELLDIGSLGPKRVKALHDELGISTKEELLQAAEAGRIRAISGFGKKTEEKILEEAQKQTTGEKRFLLSRAEEIAEPLAQYLRERAEVDRVEIAGSYRRRKETVGDVDILVTCDDATKVMDRFVAYEDVVEVISHGETMSSVVLKSDFQVDLRVVQQRSYGSALVYFTGSKEHNVAIRRIAQDRDLKISEYGVFRGDDYVAGKTEEDVYAAIELPFIAPELRENRGEVEAAQRNELPTLLAPDDMRGDLQCHSTYSDGKATMEEMARAAREMGYEYLAFTDHTKRVSMTGGLDEKGLREQMEEIDKLNDGLDGFRILKSSEVEVLKNGSLDLPDSVLKELDIVLIAAHYYRNLSRTQQTERLIRAMDDPYVQVLGHPTGRLIGSREPVDLDMEAVVDAAKERGVVLEVNAQPERLDLNDVSAKMAKERGVRISISTDAHSPSGLKAMRYGVSQARRGWLTAADVINTRSWPDVRKMLRR